MSLRPDWAGGRFHLSWEAGKQRVTLFLSTLTNELARFFAFMEEEEEVMTSIESRGETSKKSSSPI